MLIESCPNQNHVNAILNSMRSARVGVLGDLCVDMYWHADMRRSQLSRETPHHPLPIVHEVVSPGGGANVAANLAELNPAKVSVFSVIGADWRGGLLTQELGGLAIDTDGLVCAEGRVTAAYIKPMRHGISDVVYEDPRLDFVNESPPSDGDINEMLRRLRSLASELDVLCVCDQLDSGCVTERVIDTLDELSQQGLMIIADSRERIGCFHNMIIKPNDIEGAAAARGLAGLDGLNGLNGLDGIDGVSSIDLHAVALAFARRNGRGAFITLGGSGCLVSDGESVVHVPAFPAKPPLDICGAGDTFLSALALSLASGATLVEAGYIANAAASITVRKVGITGAASAEEIAGVFAAGGSL
ncbi:ADP-heptose synthase [Clostridia bacterium]|nr:ADP-heptose synthase [Clostridia bacterium]